MAWQPQVGQSLLIVEASWSHSDTQHSVGLLWMSDQPITETSTWQHTTLTRDRSPRLWQDSNPQSQQAKDCRSIPWTMGHWIGTFYLYCNKIKCMQTTHFIYLPTSALHIHEWEIYNVDRIYSFGFCHSLGCSCGRSFIPCIKSSDIYLTFWHRSFTFKF